MSEGTPQQPEQPPEEAAASEAPPAKDAAEEADAGAADDSAAEAAGDAAADAAEVDAAAQGSGEPVTPAAPASRVGKLPLQVMVALLLGLLGFTFTVQVRHVADDPTVTAQSQEDLVRILANLDAYEERLREDLAELQETHRRLSTAGRSQQEALAEAQRRADEIGVLAGTLPVTGPGLVVRMRGGEAVTAARVLDAVQELRSAGAEAMQIAGSGGQVVRVVASTYFLDAQGGGLVVDGTLLTAPYTLTVVGDPATLAPALEIPGGVVESVERDGGTVTVQEAPEGVEVSAVVPPPSLEYARPDS